MDILDIGCQLLLLSFPFCHLQENKIHIHFSLLTGLNQRKLALLDDFWVKFGSQFRTFDVQVTATRPGETSEGEFIVVLRLTDLQPLHPESYFVLG